jgi:hypothetical protein
MNETLERTASDKKKPVSPNRVSYKFPGIPKQVPRKIYSLLLSENIRDLGKSSLSFFSYKSTPNRDVIHRDVALLRKNLRQLDETEVSASLEKIERKYRTNIGFSYPVMNPVQTNSNMMNKTQLRIETVQQKFEKFKIGALCKYKKNNSASMKARINGEIEKQYSKFFSDIGIYFCEIRNRQKMLTLLKQITIPNGLKSFMEEINNLSIKNKQDLLDLITKKTRLSPKNDQIKPAYELMFAYPEGSDDLIVGLRSLYDPHHPHPTLIGGVEPSVLVAGTIDLYLDAERLKVAAIRIDSGHYRPDTSSLELVIKYFKYNCNPEYYDKLALRNFNDETVGIFSNSFRF